MYRQKRFKLCLYILFILFCFLLLLLLVFLFVSCCKDTTSARKSLASFDELRVRINGVERPIGELCDVEVKRGYSTISRIDQQRRITITADADFHKVQPNRVIGALQGKIVERDAAGNPLPAFLPELMKEYPHIHIRWEGQREQEEESFNSMKIGFSVAMLGMFVLLTMQFKSYTQPFIIM